MKEKKKKKNKVKECLGYVLDEMALYTWTAPQCAYLRCTSIQTSHCIASCAAAPPSPGVNVTVKPAASSVGRSRSGVGSDISVITSGFTAPFVAWYHPN